MNLMRNLNSHFPFELSEFYIRVHHLPSIFASSFRLFTLIFLKHGKKHKVSKIKSFPILHAFEILIYVSEFSMHWISISTGVRKVLSALSKKERDIYPEILRNKCILKHTECILKHLYFLCSM